MTSKEKVVANALSKVNTKVTVPTILMVGNVWL